MNSHPGGRPNERHEKLRTLAERVARGEYRVPAGDVATAIIAWYERPEPPQSRKAPTRR
ncbi:MAG: flagellar biosynthesis anti-sigma factor FlgM [Actinomycetota bacterium]